MVICGGHHTIGPLVGEVWVSFDHFYIFVGTYIVDIMLLAAQYVVSYKYYTTGLCPTGRTQFATDIGGMVSTTRPGRR